MLTSIIIPVYKQKEQFLANLQTNLRFLTGCEIIIVNDDPQESVKGPVFELFQSAGIPTHLFTIIEHTTNTGFGPTVNDGVHKAKGELVMLLNTDVTLYDDTWKNAVTYLESHEHIFAVGFAQREKIGTLVGRNSIYFKKGLFHHKAVEFHSGSGPVETGWVEGGAGIFRVSMWRQLGGFDEKFAPFYWEDVDLGYRARARSWESLFDPDILVEHHHKSTIGKHYHQDKINKIAYDHQLYFTRKHARGIQKVQYHLLMTKHYLKGK